MHKSHRHRSSDSDRQRSRNRSKHHHKKHHKRRSRSESEDRYRERRRSDKYKRRDDQYANRDIQEKMVQQRMIQEEIIKQLPCWEPSGILLEFYNAREGVSLKFHEPPESRPPVDVWRIYIFKGEQALRSSQLNTEPINLLQSCYLIGKDERVCDILCENETISRQHAVIQFRMITKVLEDGTFQETIRPYIMDLESTNGTFLNSERIESSRYTQLLHGDMLKFGKSQREYVMVKAEGQKIARNDQD